MQLGRAIDARGKGVLRQKTRETILVLLEDPAVPNDSRKTLTTLLTALPG